MANDQEGGGVAVDLPDSSMAADFQQEQKEDPSLTNVRAMVGEVGSRDRVHFILEKGFIFRVWRPKRGNVGSCKELSTVGLAQEIPASCSTASP